MTSSASTASHLVLTSPKGTPVVLEEAKAETPVIDFSDIDGNEFSGGSIDFANIKTRDRRNARLGSRSSFRSIVSSSKLKPSKAKHKKKNSRTPSRISLMVPPNNLMIGRDRTASDVFSTMSSSPNFYKSISIYSEENSVYMPREVSDPIFTAQAPLEIISFVYRIAREGREVSKSARKKDLPEDTLVPNSALGYTTTFESVDYDMSEASHRSYPSNPSLSSNFMFSPKTPSLLQENSKSLGFFGFESSFFHLEGADEEKSIEYKESSCLKPSEEVSDTLKPDVIVLQKSLKAEVRRDKEHLFRKTPRNATKISHASSSRQHKSPEGVSLEAACTAVLPVEASPFGWVRKKRARSNDFAYSEANEVARILVSELRNPKDVNAYLTGERKEDDTGFTDPLLHLLRDVLNSGRSRKIASKEMLKRKSMRDNRRRQKLASVSWKPDSMVSATLIRAATCREQTPPPKKSFLMRFSTIEEEETVELALNEESSAGIRRPTQNSSNHI